MFLWEESTHGYSPCHPAKFNDHRHCGNGEVMILVCHAILEGHGVKGPCDFIGGSPLWQNPLVVSHQHAMFDSYRHCGSGDIIILMKSKIPHARLNSPSLFICLSHSLKLHILSF